MKHVVCGAEDKGERVKLVLWTLPTTRITTLQNLIGCQLTDPDYKTLNSLLATSWKAPPWPGPASLSNHKSRRSCPRHSMWHFFLLPGKDKLIFASQSFTCWSLSHNQILARLALRQHSGLSLNYTSSETPAPSPPKCAHPALSQWHARSYHPFYFLHKTHNYLILHCLLGCCVLNIMNLPHSNTNSMRRDLTHLFPSAENTIREWYSNICWLNEYLLKHQAQSNFLSMRNLALYARHELLQSKLEKTSLHKKELEEHWEKYVNFAIINH